MENAPTIPTTVGVMYSLSSFSAFHALKGLSAAAGSPSAFRLRLPAAPNPSLYLPAAVLAALISYGAGSLTCGLAGGLALAAAALLHGIL